jgi:periodic tryptophan protein 2
MVACVVVELLVRSLPDVFVDRLLSHVGGRVSESCHLEYYLRWTHHLLYSHGPRLKQRSASIMASLRTLQSALTQTLDRLGKL